MIPVAAAEFIVGLLFGLGISGVANEARAGSPVTVVIMALFSCLMVLVGAMVGFLGVPS